MTNDEALIAAIRETINVPLELWKKAGESLKEQYPEGDAPIEAHAGEGFSAAYNACAEALAQVAILAFNFAAEELQVSGSQAGWAAGEILRKTMHIEGPMAIVQAENYLYPQYDEKVTNWLGSEDVRQLLQERAQEKLADTPLMSTAVAERMRLLAETPDQWDPKP